MCHQADNPSATPLRSCSRAWEPQLLEPECLEQCCATRGATGMRGPSTAAREQPPLVAAGEQPPLVAAREQHPLVAAREQPPLVAAGE